MNPASVADYQALLTKCQSLVIASCAPDGSPEASYAPFLEFDQIFYIFVSELAKHTGNLRRDGRASIMFIEDEANAANPFARQRLIFDCKVSEITEHEPAYSQILDRLQNRFGDIVGLLRTLADFHLLALQPIQGQFIAGFGKAFTINVETGELSPSGR